MEYEINHKPSKSGRHPVYYATKNGKRFSKVNYVRKYDARALVKAAIEKYGAEELERIFA